MHVYADDGTGVMQPAAGSPVALTFDANGQLTTPAPPGTVPLNVTTANGSVNPIAINWDIGDLTQYGNSFDVNNLTQDGFAPGRLTSIDVDNTGVVTARYTNGRVRALGQLALANFNNLQGLAKVGDTAWQETFASGEVRIGAPGTSNFGGVTAGALETSNTDVASQMVDLILAQRNYQANAQAVSTEGTLIQTLLNIR
jgi:flagellar hook protein FlgE